MNGVISICTEVVCCGVTKSDNVMASHNAAWLEIMIGASDEADYRLNTFVHLRHGSKFVVTLINQSSIVETIEDVFGQ